MSPLTWWSFGTGHREVSHRREARCVPNKCTPKENTPMTLSESDIDDILAALDIRDGANLVRELVQLGMQGLVEAEA